MTTQNERYVRRIKQVVALRKDLGNSQEKLRHCKRELEATKEAVRYWGNRAEAVERENKALKQELEAVSLTLGSYKMLAGILESLGTTLNKENQHLKILLDLRSNL